MRNARPAQATELTDPDRPHAEVLDPSTGKVWQSLAACEPDEFLRLELPDRLRRVGTGQSAMDEHWFDRSPGASEDGPMETRMIAGREWGHCASPVGPPSKPFGENGPTEMLIDKYHALRFVAGRHIPVLKTPDGEHFVRVIAGGAASTIGLAGAGAEGAFVIPDGCRLGDVALENDWIVRLPNPARVFFFASGDSFQGPIDSLPGEWKERT